MSDNMVKYLWNKIDEAITVIETVKKIQEYNANVSVEYALSCASMRTLIYDPRIDDKYLVKDEEPVSISKYDVNAN